ncbi:MAG: Hsp70 family protein [Pseudanabaena sp. ELA607]
MHYAIDFGTSNTVVACRADQKEQDSIINSGITTITLPFSAVILDNPPLIPSLVYVEDALTGKVLVGQEVLDRGLESNLGSASARLFRGFKRGISSGIQGNYGFVPQVDDLEVTFDQVGEWFLNRVLAELPDIESLTLTVPVDSFEAYRQWLTNACRQLPNLENIKQIRLLDEPTAAALGYGITHGTQTLLVIDFGGGTLDLSLVRLTLPESSVSNLGADSGGSSGNNSGSDSINNSINNKGGTNKPKFGLGALLKWGERSGSSGSARSLPPSQTQPTAKVLAKTGQNLGGIDVDHWLMEHFQNQIDIPHNALTMRLVEKLKIALSQQESATEVYFDAVNFQAYDLNLNRSELGTILDQAGFTQRLDQSLNQIRQQAQRQNLELSDIDGVLLVGGTAQMPAVQTWVQQHFPTAKIKSDQPFTAIAHGALSQDFALEDFLYHSYGIRFWDKRYKRHNWHPIIQQGQTYPLQQPVELTLGASMPDQPSIELIIGELGETSVEVYFDQGKILTRSLDQLQQSVRPLNENARSIAQLNPAGRQGIDRIKVTFTVDGERTLRISVKDLLTSEMLLADQAVVQLI